MKIFLADAADPDDIHTTAVRGEHDRFLISYAYRAQMERGYGTLILERAAQGHHGNLILDSGAFTAFTTGRTFTVQGYAEWMAQVLSIYGPHLASLVFLNLDVIGDQAATWRNQTALERMGFAPVPILTHTSQPEDLERILESGYPYFALGGLVALRGDKAAVKRWLDRVYHRLLQHRDQTGRLVRTHLLGCTWEWLLERYPAYSSDSSAWLNPIRFGKTAVNGLPYIPRASEPGHTVPKTHALRCEVRRIAQLERDLTRLWTARGITWENP